MAAPLLPFALGMAGASLIGGIGNFLANSDANARANAIMDKALQEWLSINIPDPEQQKIVLENFVLQGELHPVLEQAIRQEPSEFQNIFTNAQHKAQQQAALDSLTQIGQEGGLRLQDRATLHDALTQSSTRARGERDAISSEMARRGIAGSGMDVAARLSSQQAKADRDASASLRTASDAQQRALEAIMRSGKLAGDLRSQDFDEQAQRAAAKDVINRFNAQNLQNVHMRNVSTQNQAQATNLGQRQNIANMNTQTRNQQEVHNKGLLQQQYDNQLKRAQGISGIYGKQADLAINQGQNTGNLFTNLGKTGAETLGTFVQDDRQQTAWDREDQRQNKWWEEYDKRQKAGGA